MMKKSFILITMRYDYFSKIKEKRNCIDQKLCQWVIKLGFTPLLLPNIKTKKFFFEKTNLNISGIIISGGNDINKNSIRYSVEKKLLKYSIKKHLPVLGICHGMQMMSSYEGGSLKKIKNHVNKIHLIINKSLTGNYPKKVNSYHNFTIKKLSNNFDIICTCNKGSIEAIKHVKHNWLGWMWHPERGKKFNKKLLKIGKQLFTK